MTLYNKGKCIHLGLSGDARLKSVKLELQDTANVTGAGGHI